MKKSKFTKGQIVFAQCQEASCLDWVINDLALRTLNLLMVFRIDRLLPDEMEYMPKYKFASFHPINPLGASFRALLCDFARTKTASLRGEIGQKGRRAEGQNGFLSGLRSHVFLGQKRQKRERGRKANSTLIQGICRNKTAALRLCVRK